MAPSLVVAKGHRVRVPAHMEIVNRIVRFQCDGGDRLPFASSQEYE